MNTSTSADTIPTTLLPSVWATLQARDADALIAFYEEVFGFRVSVRYSEGAVVEHAELLWPEGTGAIMLGSHRPDRPWSREPGTAGTYVVTGDIDALYQRVTDRGADIRRPLADTDYGSREFAVSDPEGNLWSFGTYPGHREG